VTSPPALILPVIVDYWADRCKEMISVKVVRMNFMMLYYSKTEIGLINLKIPSFINQMNC
jgi:hypothetical protein